MLSCRKLLSNKNFIVPFFCTFHDEFSQPEIKQKHHPKISQSSEPKQQNQEALSMSKVVGHKYKVFRDEEATEIFDVEEERQRYQTDYPQAERHEIGAEYIDDAYAGLNLKRGIHGVFDIEDLVDVLRKESAEDIFVCSVPKELKYVDYMVVCNGRSYRHMQATASFVRHMFKKKCSKGDILPKIEGEKSRDWMALDLGNIALHIFSPLAREEYDLESLWAIGSEYDKESNKPQNELVELFERSTKIFYASTQNASSKKVGE